NGCSPEDEPGRVQLETAVAHEGDDGNHPDEWADQCRLAPSQGDSRRERERRMLMPASRVSGVSWASGVARWPGDESVGRRRMWVRSLRWVKSSKPIRLCGDTSTICRLFQWFHACFNRLSRPAHHDETSGR